MVGKAFLFALITFAIAMVIGMLVAFIVNLIGMAVRGKKTPTAKAPVEPTQKA